MRTAKPVRMSIDTEHWPLSAPFRISGHTFETIEVTVVHLENSGEEGRGEAVGVYYKGDSAKSLKAMLEDVQTRIESGIDRTSLREVLPIGGARNAVDCALWDLEAKLSEKSVYALAGFPAPKPLLTTFTCGADTPEAMARAAVKYVQAKAIKLKLIGDSADARRVTAVREARPDVWLSVDANQGFSQVSFERILPTLVDCNVKLIEQPFPVGQESLLDGVKSPIPIAADESVQGFADISALIGRFQAINIKLDKCGGLTEGLMMAKKAISLGLEPMVGNMIGTSLAMAPALVLGQLCNVVDLDGPIFLKSDRAQTVKYEHGMISSPPDLWGD